MGDLTSSQRSIEQMSTLLGQRLGELLKQVPAGSAAEVKQAIDQKDALRLQRAVIDAALVSNDAEVFLFAKRSVLPLLERSGGEVDFRLLQESLPKTVSPEKLQELKSRFGNSATIGIALELLAGVEPDLLFGEKLAYRNESTIVIGAERARSFAVNVEGETFTVRETTSGTQARVIASRALSEVSSQIAGEISEGRDRIAACIRDAKPGAAVASKRLRFVQSDLEALSFLKETPFVVRFAGYTGLPTPGGEAGVLRLNGKELLYSIIRFPESGKTVLSVDYPVEGLSLYYDVTDAQRPKSLSLAEVQKLLAFTPYADINEAKKIFRTVGSLSVQPLKFNRTGAGVESIKDGIISVETELFGDGIDNQPTFRIDDPIGVLPEPIEPNFPGKVMQQLDNLFQKYSEFTQETPGRPSGKTTPPRTDFYSLLRTELEQEVSPMDVPPFPTRSAELSSSDPGLSSFKVDEIRNAASLAQDQRTAPESVAVPEAPEKEKQKEKKR